MDSTDSTVIRNALIKIGITVIFSLFLLLLATGAVLKPLVASILAGGPQNSSFFELVFIGLAPLVLIVIFRENPGMYGIQKKGIFRSMILGVLLALAYRAASSLFNLKGAVPDYQSFGLVFPGNVGYALLGIFSYGPLEAFFVLYLMANVDMLVSAMAGNRSKAPVSAGILAVAAFFGLFHIVTTGSISNAVQVTLFSCCYGMIHRHTDNSIGPMTAWTISNGWVYYLLVGCLT